MATVTTGLGKVFLFGNRPLSLLSTSRVFCVHKAAYSTGEEDVKALKTTNLSTFKRGRGGRSSFNGVVATVFGASGFLGRYVINKLGKEGSQVIIPYRGDHYDVLRLKLCGDLGQILYAPFHLKDEDSLRKAMKYSNVVINLIGRDFPTKNFSFEDIHVTGPRTIARIAREYGVEKFIHVSSLNVAEKSNGVILKNGSKFLASKWRGEIAVREEFPEAIILRPSEMCGSEDRYCRYYAHPWRRQFRYMPLWNKGVGIIKQPVFVSDVAKAIMNAVSDPEAVGKTFQAVGPRRYELIELMDWFHRVMRRDRQWGYRRTNLKYDIMFWIRIYLAEAFVPNAPILVWDKIEREHTTDALIRGMPNLEDLGVTLTNIEDKVPWELKPYRAHSYYEEVLGEFEEPAPPNYIVN